MARRLVFVFLLVLAATGIIAVLAHAGCALLDDVAAERAKDQAYARAESLLEEGAHVDAAIAFEELGDYRDAASRAAEAYEMRDQAGYDQAEQLLEQGDLEAAARAFDALGTYSDAADQAEGVRAQLLAEAYGSADALAGSGNHVAAYEGFRKLGDYRDAAVRADDERMLALRGEDVRGLTIHLGRPDGKDMMWTVVSVEDGVATLVSSSVIVCPFEVALPCAWEGCPVRDWLRGQFVEETFSVDETRLLVDLGEGYVELPTPEELLAYLGDAALRQGIDWRLDLDGLLGGRASYVYASASHYTYDRDLLERQVGIRPVVRVRVGDA